jgi:hypothetical protein
MGWFRLRPTFEIPLSVSRMEVIERLRVAEQEVGKPTRFRMFGEYGELHLPAEQHRLWSPHLTFYVSQPGPGARGDESSIHGRFAPRVDVWTVVWIGYLALLFTAFFAGALGVSQWQLGEAIWGFWVALAALLSLAAIYLVAHFGQQWSVDQMQQLRDELESILRQAGFYGSGALAGQDSG